MLIFYPFSEVMYHNWKFPIVNLGLSLYIWSINENIGPRKNTTTKINIFWWKYRSFKVQNNHIFWGPKIITFLKDPFIKYFHHILIYKLRRNITNKLLVKMSKVIMDYSFLQQTIRSHLMDFDDNNLFVFFGVANTCQISLESRTFDQFQGVCGFWSGRIWKISVFVFVWSGRTWGHAPPHFDEIFVLSFWVLDSLAKSLLSSRLQRQWTQIKVQVPGFVCIWKVLIRWHEYNCSSCFCARFDLG